MPSLDRLEELVAIVDAGSISGAARALGLPRTTLSRRLSGLEEELGVRLMHRETRRLVLTSEGETLVGRARCLVEDAEAAWAAVERHDDAPRGRLRVSFPPTLMFHELLLGFAEAFPEVDLEVSASARHVDLLNERVDVALRFGTVGEPGLIARRLFTDELSAVAAPRYLDRHGRPELADELVRHRCILGYATGWRRETAWPLIDGGRTAVSGRFVSDELPIRLDAGLRALGIVLLPEPVTRPYIAKAQLEFVLRGVVGASTGASLVFPERDYMPPQVRAFIDHTVTFYDEGFRTNPAVWPTASGR